MTEAYTLTISNSRSGLTLATATIEIEAGAARLTEVRAETSADEAIPNEMTQVDFPLLIRTVAMLSSLQSPASKAPAVNKTEKLGASQDPPPAPKELAKPAEAPPEPRPEQQEHAFSTRPQKASAPADFGVTYWRLGSISKVAKHYDVPHHIAQDWIRSLQQQGKLANPWPSKNSRPIRPR